MKIRREVCEKLEAEVLCFADEAVLCRGCDEQVHAANKLSQKHERVRLLKHPSSPSSSADSSHAHLPPCDICKGRNGYLFCLEDRVLLCRHCDIATHMGNPYASPHQRFLIGGVNVALQSTISNNNIVCDSLNSSSPMSTAGSFTFLADNESRDVATTMGIEAAFPEAKPTFPSEPHFATGPHWSLDEIFKFLDE
ncbi:hypothetical protein CJ030_MR6G018126 [Morella rubra]|uniref:B box-type domain-containing protein n=1 Tax=Morella rubra TaxID=262757 RepID=A0A6A1VJA6_9ROSI|nr:hypothetical protein CJ030_MR6G019597 [Morella rubra]KAB1211140.1 hypothetical protein CJ030_MR6G018126 [Morella rubra]